jgi:diacylglycerol kinase family enzyme
MAILPLGTANNIAVSLGARGPIESLARLWHEARPLPVDLGIARGSWGTQHFIEGIGGGLVPAAIASMTARPAPAGEPAPWRLTRALRRYSELLASLRPAPWTLTIDGRPASGDYLLVEVMNMRSVGPNLALAAGADPSDGALDVVTIGEEARDVLARGLEALRDGRDVEMALPVQRARSVDIGCPCDIHIDDQLVRDHTEAPLSIGVEPGALLVLDTRP